MRARASSGDAAVECHLPGDHPIEQIAAPSEFLSDCEGRKDDPVTLELRGDRQIIVQWRDGSVPQMVQYDDAEPVDSARFPRLPEELAENAPAILAALRDAAETTEPAAFRYATNCIQLRGTSGQLAATDGRQLLIQSGFRFPWDEDLLVLRNRVFGCKELPHNKPVRIGKTDTRLALSTGPWKIFLALNQEGRFPDVDHHIPPAESAVARFEVCPADAEFLAKSLPRLPGDDEYNLPVTVDLNGQVGVRARAAGQRQPTELVLSGSTSSGEPISINTNRKFLLRAVRLGLGEVLVFGNRAPVLCQDDRRKYVWALLNPESAVRPSPDAIRIQSSQGQGPAERPIPKSRRRKASMPTSSAPENVPARPKRRARTSASGTAPQQETAGLIEQAEAVRASLRDALSRVDQLVRRLKQHRKEGRIMHSALAALASLRQLQTLDS